MQYLGGKVRIAKQVANVLKQHLGNHKTYLEPFCGALNVTVQMADCGLPIIAADANQYLITLWQAVFNGWEPPEKLSEQEYKEIKDNKDIANPMTAFAGFGCSFSGKWFGGFCRNKRERNYAKDAKNSILRKYQKLKDSDIEFESISYEEWGPRNHLIYCDPPYQSTTGYGATDNFDHDKFWNWARLMSKFNTVIISEYQAPSDFECIAEFATKTDLRNGEGVRMDRAEKLFKWRSENDNN